MSDYSDRNLESYLAAVTPSDERRQEVARQRATRRNNSNFLRVAMLGGISGLVVVGASKIANNSEPSVDCSSARTTYIAQPNDTYYGLAGDLLMQDGNPNDDGESKIVGLKRLLVDENGGPELVVGQAVQVPSDPSTC